MQTTITKMENFKIVITPELLAEAKKHPEMLVNSPLLHDAIRKYYCNFNEHQYEALLSSGLSKVEFEEHQVFHKMNIASLCKMAKVQKVEKKIKKKPKRMFPLAKFVEDDWSFLPDILWTEENNDEPEAKIRDFYATRYRVAFGSTKLIIAEPDEPCVENPYDLMKLLRNHLPPYQVEIYHRYEDKYGSTPERYILVSPQICLLSLIMMWRYRIYSLRELFVRKKINEMTSGGMRRYWVAYNENPLVANNLCHAKFWKNFNTVDLLLSGDVEEHPGPIQISKLLCKFLFSKEGKIEFVLPNNYTFTMDADKVKESEDLWIFEIDDDRTRCELEGSINQKNVFHKKGNFSGPFKLSQEPLDIIRRTSRYTDHDNFDPDKRLSIDLTAKIYQYLCTNDIRMALEKSEGHVRFLENFCFIPKNLLKVRFSKVNYFYHDLDKKVTFLAMSSVGRQTMNLKQITKMAVNLSTAQMMHMEIQNNFELLISTFVIFFESNVSKMSRNQSCNFSMSDVWTEFFKIETVYIPTVRTKTDDPKYVFKTEHSLTTNIDFRIEHTENGLKLLAEKVLGTLKISEMSDEELFKNYETGLLSIYEGIKPFSFNNQKFQFQVIKDKPNEMTEEDKLLKFLVEDRLNEVDIFKTFVRTARFALRTLSSDIFRNFIKVVVKFEIQSFYQPGLTRLMKKEDENLESYEFGEFFNQKIDFVNKFLTTERRITSIMQNEFYTWSKILFNEPNLKPVFNNFDYIKYLAGIRRMPIVNVGLLDEKEKAESKGIFSRMSAPFKAMSNLFSNTVNGISNLSDFKTTVERLEEKFGPYFTKEKLPNFMESVKNIDFGTVKGTLNTIKMLINSWFTDFVQGICGLFGVEYTQQIDATKLLFYYIIWQHNDSTILRFLLIADILADIGILDQVMVLLKDIFDQICEATKPVVCGFQDVLKDLKEKTQTLKVENSESVRKVISEETPFSLDSEGWIKTLIDNFMFASPAILGIAATSFIAYLGLPKFDSKTSIGDKVASAGKNLGFMALGLAAFPKIFENILKVVTFVIDYAKSIVLENHKTKFAYLESVKKWLISSMYLEGLTERIFVRDLDYCFGFLKNYNQMVEILPRVYDIESPALRMEVLKRTDLMKKLHPVCLSAVRIALNQREVFHVQLYSEPGLGKTDLCDQILKVLKSSYHKMDSELRDNCQLKNPMFNTNDIYPLNDQLKHNDMYFGQKAGYSDDESVFSDTDAETIIQKMTMMSGFPCISQQASLNDKGRIFEFNFIVSNTNNPYLKHKGMLKPEAIWRRRQLFKIDIKPQFATDGKLDEQKILAAGINRTLGEHLTVSWMHNTKDCLKNNDCKDLEVKDFLELVYHLSMQHYQTEEKRLLIKSKSNCLIRYRYEAIREEIEEKYAQTLGKDPSLKELSQNLVSLQGRLKEDKIFEPYYIQDLIDLSEFITPSDDDVVQNAMEHQNCGFLDFKEENYMSYRLHYRERNGKFIYYLRPSDKRENIHDGDFDFSGFDIQKIDGVDRVVYVSDTLLDQDKFKVLSFHLIDLSSYSDISAVKSALISKITKQKGKSSWSIWEHKLNVLRSRTTDVLKSIASSVFNFVFKMIPEYLFQGVAISIAVVGLFFSLSMIGQVLVPQNVSYNQAKAKTIKLPPPKTVACFNDDMTDIVRDATYMFQVVNKNGRVSRATMIGVVGSIFLVNKHSFSGPCTIAVYDHKNSKNNVKEAIKIFNVEDSDISEIPGCDAMLINIRGFRPVRSVQKHFVTERDCEQDLVNFHYFNSQALLLRFKNLDKIDFLNDERELYYTEIGESYPYSNYNLTASYYHDRVVHVNTGTKITFGDSGSVVLHMNPKVSQKILGIILAKQDIKGGFYVGVVTQEQLQKAMLKFPNEHKIRTEPKEGIPITVNHELYNVFDFNDEVYDSPFKNQAISRSLGFKKSDIFEIFPVETQPAIQDIRDPRIQPGTRHMMKVSLNKCNGVIQSVFSAEEERFMCSHLENVYHEFVDGLPQVRLYSTQQAIMGIRSMGSTSINTKTCAGLPYKLEPGVVGKTPMIQYNEESKSYQIQNRVFNDVEQYWDTYQNLHVPYNHKLEFRKKELVPEEKIKNPKTRTVGTGNFIQQICYNRLFKDLHTMVKNQWENGKSTPFALGVDPERHWNQVAEHLQFLDYLIDFDVKAWEEKMDLRFLFMTAKVKLKLLKDAYRSRGQQCPDVSAVAYGLAVDFTDTEVIYEDVMYRKRSGLLSGHPGTFMENSEVHEMILGLVVRRILKKFRPAWANSRFIIDHVRSIKAADDILIAVSPLARNFVTVERLVEGYNALAFEVTSADKISKIRAKHILEVQFLKQHFQILDGKFFPVPNLSIVYQLLNWVRDDTKLTITEQFKTNLDNAFRFLFWRGEEEYEIIRAKANLALRQYHLQWTYTHSEMSALVRQLMQDSEAEANTPWPQWEDVP